MTVLRVGAARWIDQWVRIPVAVRVVAPAAVMVVLWISSSRVPSQEVPSALRVLLHNGAHVVAYVGLGAAWLLTLMPGRRDPRAPPSSSLVAAAVVLSVAYGVIDEVHQSFVPGRCPSYWDVASDACGSALAVTGIQWLVTGARHFVIRLGLLFLLALVSVSAGTQLE